MIPIPTKTVYHEYLKKSMKTRSKPHFHNNLSILKL
nr:MAG TPA: hypothetical protein [Caudoviricetes sp.]DAS48351.1 MAG TPA: hypothetical protein [Caudoviricetes sp.]